MLGRNLGSLLNGDVSVMRCSRAANSIVLAPIWPNFELIQDAIDVLVTCKNEEDQIKNEGAKSVHNIKHQFFRRSRADNSGGRNLNSYKLSCMSSLPVRMKMIQSKMKTL